jgi:hypothetical protein
VSELGLALGAEYFRSLGANVTRGTSALFALTTDPSMREVADAFRGTEAELLATNLTPERGAAAGRVRAHRRDRLSDRQPPRPARLDVRRSHPWVKAADRCVGKLRGHP